LLKQTLFSNTIHWDFAINVLVPLCVCMGTQCTFNTSWGGQAKKKRTTGKWVI